MKFPPQMDLSGLKHPEKVQAIQWCECRGKQHRLALINNSIVPLDHNMQRELAMLDLGGDPCRCMKVYLGIRKQETKNVIPDFAPYMEEMRRKHESRSYGIAAIETKLHEKDRPPKQVQRLIELLLRYKCRYDFPEHMIITVTSTGARSFVRGNWYYRNGLGSTKYMVLQVNVPKNWKKEVYDLGIAVVDDCFVLGRESTTPFRLGPDKKCDHGVVFMAQGRGEALPENYRFGSKNAIIIYAHGKWRFNWMDSRVYYHDHQR